MLKDVYLEGLLLQDIAPDVAEQRTFDEVLGFPVRRCS